MTTCYYNYDPLTGKFDKPIVQSFENTINQQVFVPFDNISKKGWCNFHKHWETVTIQNNNLYFSCGIPVQNRIAQVDAKTLNQIIFRIEKDKKTLSITRIDNILSVRDNSNRQIVLGSEKTIDLLNSKVFHPKDCDLTEIPDFISQRIDFIIASFCKDIFGNSFHIGKNTFVDFVKYPPCPLFNKISLRVDGIKNYNFRLDPNLFKDFCKLMKITETKRLRKDFNKDPYLIFLHAMTEFIGFIDPNAIKLFVENKDIYEKFINQGTLRFSIKRRCVYLDDYFFRANWTSYELNFLDGLRLWVQNARTDKSDIVVMKRMINCLLTEEFSTLSDAIKIYTQNVRTIPNALHERIIKECFSMEVHNQLVQYFGIKSDSKGEPYKIVEYKDDELDFEKSYPVTLFDETFKKRFANPLLLRQIEEEERENEEKNKDDENIDETEENLEEVIKNRKAVERNLSANFKLNDSPMDEEKIRNELELKTPHKEKIDTLRVRALRIDKMKNAYNFSFLLPLDTENLYEISGKMRNCVGYLYKNKVLERTSTIVVLIRENEFKACLELKKQPDLKYKVVQAFGPLNRYITIDNKPAIELWKRECNITGEIHYDDNE